MGDYTVEELRAKLKNDRSNENIGTGSTGDSTGNTDSISVDSPSTSVERYAPNELNKDGYSVQPVSRPGLGVGSVVRTVSDIKRKSADKSGSASQVDNGERPSDRRLGNYYHPDRSDGRELRQSGESGTGRATRSVGNLEASEIEIPERYFSSPTSTNEEESSTATKTVTKGKTTETLGASEADAPTRKRGRPRKSGIVEAIPVFGKIHDEAAHEERKARQWLRANTFSKSEAQDLEEPLIAALQDEFKLLDQALWKYANDELEQPIWSDITEKEMSSLAHIVLKLGQKSPVAATMVRTAIDGSDYIVAGGLLAPRFMQTVEIVRTVRHNKRVAKANGVNPRNRRSRIRSIRTEREQAPQSVS